MRKRRLKWEIELSSKLSVCVNVVSQFVKASIEIGIGFIIRDLFQLTEGICVNKLYAAIIIVFQFSCNQFTYLNLNQQTDCKY